MPTDNFEFIVYVVAIIIALIWVIVTPATGSLSVTGLALIYLFESLDRKEDKKR